MEFKEFVVKDSTYLKHFTSKHQTHHKIFECLKEKKKYLQTELPLVLPMKLVPSWRSTVNGGQLNWCDSYTSRKVVV